NSYREPHEAIPHQQPSQPPPTVSYRYGPSGYPPSRQSEPALRSPTAPSQKTPFTDALNNITNSRAIQQRLEESKRSRDEEIKYLETLPYRTPQHDERLRKLLIDREFQKRAEEMGADEDEDEDDEVLDRADTQTTAAKL
ncbi:unnamed protein product, partial [Medioppia subpectinata]